jgi:SAM-dependent methyltransferase
VSDSSLTDLVTRLERERLEADGRYNAALTALDRALPGALDLPAPSEPTSTGGSRVHGLADLERDSAVAKTYPQRGLLGHRRAVWSLVGPALEQQQRFNAAVVDQFKRRDQMARETRAATAALIERTRQHLDALATFHSRLIQYLQQITPYVDTKNRAMGGADLREQVGLANERTLSLKREIERMSAGRTAVGDGSASGAAAPIVAQADHDAFKYLGFEDRFRGPRDEIRRRLTDYLPIFTGASAVLDVGCGRGELLELFRESGIDARGIDTNERMVSLCTERGLPAEQADALSYLRAQPAASLGGLIAIQVVEHLPPDYLMAFLEAAFHALRPGAPIVLETINVSCWMAFFETYMRDLTHARPLHPDTLRFLAEASGFTEVDITFRSPVRDEDRLPHVDAAASHDPSVRAVVEAVNAHAEQLNTRLFTSMDYALIARR